MTSVNFFGGIRTTSRVEAYLRVEEWLRKVGSRCFRTGHRWTSVTPRRGRDERMREIVVSI